MRKSLSWRLRGAVMALAWHRPDGAYICNWCMARLSHQEVVIDHFVPLARGGSNDIGNLVVSCKRCNQIKGSLHPSDAEAKINAALEFEYEKGGMHDA